MENTNKGFKQSGAMKKALATLMALVMVLSCWVFAPEMFLKAEAASGSSYNFRLVVNTTNSVDVGDNKDLTYTITYKAQNGYGISSGTTTKTSSYTFAENSGSQTLSIGTLNGFITEIKIACTYAWTAAVQRYWKATFTLQVQKSDNNWTDVCSKTLDKTGGNLGQTDVTLTFTIDSGLPTATSVGFTTAPTSLTIPKTGATNSSTTYTANVYDQYGKQMTYDPSYYVRTSAPSSAQTSSSTITGVSIDSSSGSLTLTSNAQMAGVTDAKTVYVHAKYGSLYDNATVVLNDPTYTFKYYNPKGGTVQPNADTTGKYGHTFSGTISGTRTGFTPLGFFQSDSAIEDSYGTDNTSGKTKLTTSTVYNNDYNWYFAWQANKYTATYKYYDGAVDENNVSALNWTTTTQYDYYGYALTPPATVPENFIDSDDFKYTFTGWSPAIGSTTTMPAYNQTYTAQYSKQLVSANYDEVVAQIARANALMATDFWKDPNNNNECGYTDASVSALNAAYNAAVESNNNRLGASKQSTVDNIALALKNAVDNAELKKFTVLFLDEQGNILPGGYYFVEYGTTTVTAPSITTKAYDETYHYINGQWDTAMSDSLSDLSYITKDLRYFAKFDAVEHTYTNSANWQTIASTCSSAGQIIKTCDEATCDHTITVDNESSDPAHHVWMATYTVDIPATCTTPGSKSKHCVNCGISDPTTSTSIPATGHAWDKTATGADDDGWVTVAAATCTRAGQKQRTCSTCNYTEFTTIPATNVHNYQFESTIAATCNTAGYDVYLCTMCQAIERRNETSALGHKWKTDADTDSNGWKTIVESSCVTEGFKERQCERCLAKETEVLPVAAHTVPDDYTTITAATCTEKGEEAKFCTVCNAEIENTRRDIDALGHDYVEQVNIPATCQQPGLKVEVCSRCSGTIQTPSAQLEHHMVKDNAGSQTATCTLSGYDKMVCDNDISGQPCGYTEYTNMIDPLGHSYVTAPDFSSLKTYGTTAHEGDADYFTYTSADCTHAAYWTLTCKRDGCGNTVVVRDEDHGATQHTWVLNTTATDGEGNKLTYPATCETDGQNYYECSNPNCEAIKKEDVPKLGHNWGEWVITTPATNDTDGVMTRTCSRGCTETAPIPKGEHEFDMENPYDVTPATCYSEGSQKFGCKTHTDCGVYIEVTIPMTPHDIKVESQAETCTENGYVLTYCSCWTEEQIANYLADGTPGQCSFEPVLTETYATGHSYDYEHGITTPPTCTEDGKTVYTCTRCLDGTDGHTTTVTIPKLGHDYAECSDANYTPATCMNGGYWSCECSRCDDVNIIRNESDPSTGHVWIVNSDTDSDGWKVTTQPNCTTDGTKERTCKYACDTTETATVPALGHNFDDTIESNVAITAPTCTSDGTKTVKCSRCDVTETTTLSVLGHDWIVALENRTPAYLSTFIPAAEDTAYIRYVDATCAHGGYWELICKRDGCGAVYTVTNYENDPASNVPHTWNTSAEGADADGWVVDTAATCVTTGEKHRDCTVCNLHETAVIDALGHEYNSGEVTTAPTCNDDGVMTYTCMREGCTTDTTGHTYTEEIPALGHDFDDTIEGNVTITAPTCITDGTKTVKCSRCEKTQETSIAATGTHVYGKEEVTPPTCEAAGYTTHYCTADPNCTVSYRDTPVPATGHAFSTDWTVDVHPTCTENGSKSRHCEHEGCTEKVDVMEIGKLGHDFTEWTVIQSSTCTNEGVKEHSCTNPGCTYSESAVIAKLPHQWQNDPTVDVAPTCTSTGQKSVHCGVCGTIKTSTISTIGKLPHNYDITDIADVGAADNGSYTWESYRCETCLRFVSRPTFYAHDPNGYPLKDVQVVLTTFDGATIISKGTTNENGSFTVDAALELGEYAVELKLESKNYIARGYITVFEDGHIEGLIGIEGNLTVDVCKCSCHKDNIISKLKRTFYTFLSYLLKRTIKCCEDMEWYGSYAEKLK